MTALLTDNLPLLAGAPNGIKKLRVLILELAVRGKLLAQNPDDEPACQLLKRITKEKRQFEVTGKIRKQKPLSQIIEEEQPFELPAGWAWARLADIALSQAGFAFKSNGFNQAGLGLPLIRIRDVGQAFSGTYYEGDYRPEFLVQRGDYLISMDGEFRVAAWEGEASLLNQRVSRLIFFSEEIARRFMADSLQARLLELQGIKAYTTVDHLSGGQISESVIALPPLAEQHRIVAKVDELMALCDCLEAQQADAESAHAQLVQALLDSLAHASDAAEFVTNWRRLSEHFHTLFTTEPSIDALEQSVLQLAVMGKLVPQDPSDAPASGPLESLQAERAQLVKKGKLNAEKVVMPVGSAEKPFELPIGWVWERLPNISFFQEGPGIMAKDFRSSGVPLIRIAGMRSAFVTLEGCNFLEEEMVREKWDHFRLEPDDVVLSASASLGKVSKVGTDAVGGIVYTGLIRFKVFSVVFDEYLIRFLGSSEFARQIDNNKRGAAISHFGPTHLRKMIVPVPPLFEQHRIVAKVDQLMALCGQLKTRMTQARQLNEQLASTLIEQAVA